MYFTQAATPFKAKNSSYNKDRPAVARISDSFKGS